MYTTVLWRAADEVRCVQFKTGDDACEVFEVGDTIPEGEAIDGVFPGVCGNDIPFANCTVIVRKGWIQSVVPGNMAVGGVWIPCSSEEKPDRNGFIPVWLDGGMVLDVQYVRKGGLWISCLSGLVAHPSHWLKVVPPEAG